MTKKNAFIMVEIVLNNIKNVKIILEIIYKYVKVLDYIMGKNVFWILQGVNHTIKFAQKL